MLHVLIASKSLFPLSPRILHWHYVIGICLYISQIQYVFLQIHSVILRIYKSAIRNPFNAVHFDSLRFPVWYKYPPPNESRVPWEAGW